MSEKEYEVELIIPETPESEGYYWCAWHDAYCLVDLDRDGEHKQWGEDD